jgi:hypothetical protein
MGLLPFPQSIRSSARIKFGPQQVGKHTKCEDHTDQLNPNPSAMAFRLVAAAANSSSASAPIARFISRRGLAGTAGTHTCVHLLSRYRNRTRRLFGSAR